MDRYLVLHRLAVISSACGRSKTVSCTCDGTAGGHTRGHPAVCRHVSCHRGREAFRRIHTKEHRLERHYITSQDQDGDERYGGRGTRGSRGLVISPGPPYPNRPGRVARRSTEIRTETWSTLVVLGEVTQTLSEMTLRSSNTISSAAIDLTYITGT